jgi:SAM-dependent methyltransferase
MEQDNTRATEHGRATLTPYLLDNAGKEAPARFDALAAMFDTTTIRHLEDRGVSRGWQCLEVGGGGGSIATWLADRVGPAGRVLVTDIDPRHLDALNRPNVDVQRHDIMTDPLPASTFDLIHARLVLVHLPEWKAVLDRLCHALKPGGWLIDEEFDSLSAPPDPSVSPGEVLLTTHVAMGRLMADRGFDRRYGRLLFARLRAQGLVQVAAEARMTMVPHGSPGAALARANYDQLRDALIAGGYITAQEIADDFARLDDPEFLMPSSIMWTCWGRRPMA